MLCTTTSTKPFSCARFSIESAKGLSKSFGRTVRISIRILVFFSSRLNPLSIWRGGEGSEALQHFFHPNVWNYTEQYVGITFSRISVLLIKVNSSFTGVKNNVLKLFFACFIFQVIQNFCS